MSKTPSSSHRDLFGSLHKLQSSIVGGIFHFLLLPKYFVHLSFIPGCLQLCFLSIGDVLLISPLAILAVVGYHSAFVIPSIEGSGWIAWYAIVATFLLANKKANILTILLGLSWERLVNYHYIAAVLSIVLSCFHGYVAFTGSGGSGDGSSSGDRRLDSNDSAYSLEGSDTNLWKYLWDGGINTSGTLLTICMIALVALSAFRVFRKYWYEIWLVLHVLLSVAVIVFGLMHAIGTMFIIGIVWGADLAIRYVVQTMGMYPKSAQLSVQEDIVEIRFESPIKFEAGQYVRIAVPAVSLFEFHAATISSAPHEDFMTLHFKVMGGWTSKLQKLAEKEPDGVSVLLEGPYGGMSMNLDSYDTVLLVCGGVGVTPMMSLVRDRLHRSKNKNQKVQLVWAVRDLKLTETLPILANEGNEVDLENPSSTVIFDDSSSETVETSHQDDSQLPPYQADVYVTKKSKKRPPTTRNQNSTAMRVHSGRPDMNSIIEDLPSHNVAILACGPLRLVESTKIACRKHSGCGARRDFHEEIFDY